jgi:peptidoglycan/LPS O-acetylase OafA/YrhL
VVGVEKRGKQPRDDRYMPQLDGLRAFAVGVVLIEHYIPMTDPVRSALPWGTFGVRLFFVLSGFLITGILYRCRLQLEAGEMSLRAILRSFFARRFIRLMPVYYVYLLACIWMLPFGRPYLWAFALYLQNFLFAMQPEVFAKLLAHFWSLAVEEQFYLTWPLVILLVPTRRLVTVLCAFIIAGPIFRLGGLVAGFLPLQIDMMMPAHFDTLGLGGLFAVLASSGPSGQAWAARLRAAGLWIGLPMAALAIVAQHRGALSLWLIFAELGMGLFFAWVVTGAAKGFRGVGGKILGWSVLEYLGKISYGIYVYHFNVPGLVRYKLAPRLGIALPEAPWLKFPIYAAITVIIASASWRWMEKPINRLKNRFAYSPR